MVRTRHEAGGALGMTGRQREGVDKEGLSQISGVDGSSGVAVNCALRFGGTS